MNKILVTGGSGFIGQRLLSLLPSDRVTLLGRTIPDFFLGQSEIKCINSVENYQSCLVGIDVVVHLAAVAHNVSDDPEYIDEVNVGGTLNLASQAIEQGVKRFIFISSIVVLGEAKRLPFDEKSVAVPHSKYAESKLKAEIALQELTKETTLDVVIIRPVLVYGRNAPGNFGKLISLIRIAPILPLGLARNKRSFISIDNLVDFIKICIDHPNAKNEIFNISDDYDVSIKEFTSAIADGLSVKRYQLPVPIFIFRALGTLFDRGDQVEQLVADLQVDNSKARRLLNWAPSETMAQAMNKLS